MMKKRWHLGWCWNIAIMLCLVGNFAYSDTKELSSAHPKYQEKVQGGVGYETIRHSYNVIVPNGQVAKVSLRPYGSGFGMLHCESARFTQEVSGIKLDMWGKTTEFFANARVDLSVTASNPSVSWTQIVIDSYFPIAGAYAPHWSPPIYHYYSAYKAECNYTISVEYEKLLPDLTVSDVSLSSYDAAVDETVTLSYSVRNVGRLKSNVSSVVRIYDGSKQICGDQTIPTMSAGSYVSRTVTLPSLTAGMHTLRVVADATEVLTESRESNNSESVSLRDYTRTPVDVVFDLNGLSKQKKRSVVAGDLLGEPLPVVNRKGYDFNGWWSEPDDGYLVSGSEKITRPRTFYAHWTAKQSAVALNRQNGYGGDSSVTMTFDLTPPMVAVPSRLGHSFRGYWSDVEGKGTQYYDSFGNGLGTWNCDLREVTLYALWEPIVSSVVFDFQGGIDGSASAITTFEAKLPKIVIPKRSGWVFQGYFSSEKGVGVQYYDGNGNGVHIWDQLNETPPTLYAHWLPTRMTYSFTIDLQDGTGKVVPMTATYGELLPMVDVPNRAQYAFEGYFSQPDGQGEMCYNSQGEPLKRWDVTTDGTRVYAKWSKAYRVRFDPNGGSGAIKTQYFTEPTWKLAANTFQNKGFVFAGWAFASNESPVSADIPVFADGAVVNKTLLGYGSDPDAAVVTLYAKWGREIRCSVVPNVRLVTGGNGDGWTSSQSGFTCETSGPLNWLSASFPTSGTLQQKLSVSKGAVGGGGFEERNFVVSSDKRGFHEMGCQLESGTSDEVNAQIQIGETPSLVTWYYYKSCGMDDSGTDEIKNQRNLAHSEVFDVIMLEVVEMVKKLVKENTINWTKSYDEEIVDAVESVFEDWYGRLDLELFLSGYISLDTSSLTKALNRLTTDGVKIRDACHRAGELMRFESALDAYLNGVGYVKDVSWRENCDVAFLVNDGSEYDRSMELLYQKNATHSEVFDVIMPEVVEMVKKLVKENTINWTKSYDEEIADTVESVFELCFEGWVSSSSLPLSIQSSIANVGFAVSSLNKALDNLTTDGVKIINACRRAGELMRAEEELESRIRDLGLLKIQSVGNGGLLGVLPTPDEVTGHDFDGWWTAPAGGVRVDPAYVVTNPMKLYARWKVKTFTVRFDANGGSPIPDRVIEYGDKLGDANGLPIPTKDGFSFAGWVDLASGSTASILTAPLNDVTYQAQWTKLTDWPTGDAPSYTWRDDWKAANQYYNISYSLCGGAYGVEHPDRATCDTEFLVSAPTRVGYTFVGWTVTSGLNTSTAKWGPNSNPTASLSSSSMKCANGVDGDVYFANLMTKVGGNVTLTANWRPNSYSIRFVPNGGVGTMPNQPIFYDVADRLSANVFTREGLRFMGWAESASGDVAYRNRATVKNLAAAQGAIVPLYAIWGEAVDPSDLHPADESVDLAAANTYNAFVWNGECVVGYAQVKTAKGSRNKTTGEMTATVTATVTDAAGKKWSYSKGKVGTDGMVSGLVCSAKGAVPLAVSVGAEGVTGFWGEFAVSGSRNAFSVKGSDAAAALTAHFQRSWTLVLGLDDASAPTYLQLNIKAKGAVAVAGKLPDGTKVSASTQLILDEDGNGWVPVSVVLKKVGSLRFLVRLDAEAQTAELVGDCRWTLSDGKAVTGEAEFRLDEGGATVPPVQEGAGYEPSVNNMVGVNFAAQVLVNGLGYPAKFSAKGLPKGLKIDAATGAITGVPTKAGSFPVTVTVAGTANSKWAKAVIPFAVEIAQLPAWAQGAFTGYATDANDGAELFGAASLSVSAAGKVSGKATVAGTAWSFAATGYAADSAAADGVLRIAATAKKGKLTRELSLEVTALASPDDQALLANGRAAGAFGKGRMAFWRTVWSDKATKDAAKRLAADWKGVYAVRLPAHGEAFAGGWGYLSLAVSDGGSVKATGKLADGTAVSLTAPLCFGSGREAFVVLCASPSAYKGGSVFLPLGFAADLSVAELSSFDTLWTSLNPQATGDYTAGGFRTDFSGVKGAWHDKLEALRDRYASLTFALDKAPELGYAYKCTDYDDSGRKTTESWQAFASAADTFGQLGNTVTFDAKGKLIVAKKTNPVKDKESGEYIYAGVNDGALTLSYNAATGVFKGSYTLWYDYESAFDGTKGKSTFAHKSKKINFEGIVVEGLEPSGFYLWSQSADYTDAKGKTKSYTWKESCPIWLDSAE